MSKTLNAEAFIKLALFSDTLAKASNAFKNSPDNFNFSYYVADLNKYRDSYIDVKISGKTKAISDEEYQKTLSGIARNLQKLRINGLPWLFKDYVAFLRNEAAKY